MADTNAQMEELARILEEVNRDLAYYGKITKQTADDMFDADIKAKTAMFGGGINNATKGMEKFGDAAGYVAGAAMSAGKAMLEGKKGASAFNESIDSMAQAATAAAVALALMNPFGKVVGLLIAGVTAAVGAFAAYTKAANTMADQLYKTYSGLSKAGGAASDGMSGVLKASNQLGLSMDEMGEFVGQIAANSKDLALFSGSVYEGRQRIGDLGETLKGSREDFLKMGMSMTDVSDGMLGYMKIQTRLGNSQTMTNAQLAEGAKKYLVEQDALTKLTGQTRKEMEDQRERALQGEQFAAKIRELQLQGPEGKKAAEELMKMNAIYEQAGPKMAAAFQASVTGNLSNADAQAANLASNGAMLETTQKVIAGQMSYTDAVTITGTAMGKTADSVGIVLGQFNAYNENFGPINEQLKLAQLAQGDITAKMAKIKEDQEKILAGGVDPMLAKQAELINTQISANEAMKNFISKGIGPAQDAMIALANATIKSANLMNELTPGGKKLEGTAKEVVSTVGGAGMGAGVGAVAGGLIGLLGGPAGAVLGAKLGAVIGTGIGGYLLKNTAGDLIDQAQGTEPPGRAAGGPVDAGKLYKVGESGEEFFRPKLAGEIIPNNKLTGMTSGSNMANPAASDSIKSLVASLTVVSKSMTTGSREMDDAFDEIAKDSVKLERLTDADTKRAEKYSIAYKSYVDLKTQLMDLETPDLKSQIDILQQKAAAAGTSATGNAGGAPGGTGMKMPAAGNMPAMGGGQGVAGGIASQNDLTKMGLKLKTGDVQAEGSKIDPKIIELAQQVQANMPNFAYFSGFNDKFHQEKSPSSSHTTGRAMDFALSKQPSVEEGQEITKWLKSMGASVAIDEYNNPSAKATAGHIHAQIPGYADGGIASTPQIAMVAEKGPEAMIPLDKGAIPINLNMDAHLAKIFETGFGELSAQFAKLNDIDLLKSTVSDFKNGNFGLADPKDMLKSESTEARASLDQGAKVYEKLLAEALEKQAAQQAEQSSRMIDALFEMIRTQKDSNSIQERILQTSM
jgi:hypothetical protein